MRNIYRLLSFVFITCGLCLTAFASDGDSSTVGGSPENKFRHHFLIGLTKDSSAPKIYFTRVLDSVDGEDRGVPVQFGGVVLFNARYRDIKTKDWQVTRKSFETQYNGAALISLNMNMQIAPGFNTIMTLGLTPRFNGELDPDNARDRFFGGVFGATVNYRTRFAMIKLGAGSVVTGMSNLFVSGSGNAGRVSPFYRMPWENPIFTGGSFMTADNSIFRYGSGNANLDAFYTNGGRTNGFVIQLSQMPWNLGLNIGYGVDQQTFGHKPNAINPNPSVYNNLDPSKKTFGVRLYKNAGVNIFGANMILNNGHWQNISDDLRETQYMWSGDVYLRLFDYVTVTAEAGATAFTNPYGKWNPDSTYSFPTDPTLLEEYNSGVSYLGKVSLQVDERKFGLPFQIGAYSLGPNYINLNSATFNTFTYNNSGYYIDPSVVNMVRGVITDVGQTANNRRAAELNTSLGKGKFRVNMGTQVSQEIEKESSVNLNEIMFAHKLNVFSKSTLNAYNANGGPYGNLYSTYFQVRERVSITDTVIDYRKTFNSVSIDARYKTDLFGKTILFENYINYQSASDQFSPSNYLC